MSRFDWIPGSGVESRTQRSQQHEAHEELESELSPSKSVHISWSKILKWGGVLLGVFGAGYVLRGYADSAKGTASLLESLRGKRPDGDLSGLGMWPSAGIGRAPSPEELAYWSTYYKRGAAAVGELPSSVLPAVPRVEPVALPPPSPEEKSAERALLASPRAPRVPRYAWGGGYSDGFPSEEYDIVREG
jgi:hypothetical protein